MILESKKTVSSHGLVLLLKRMIRQGSRCLCGWTRPHFPSKVTLDPWGLQKDRVVRLRLVHGLQIGKPKVSQTRMAIRIALTSSSHTFARNHLQDSCRHAVATVNPILTIMVVTASHGAHLTPTGPVHGASLPRTANVRSRINPENSKPHASTQTPPQRPRNRRSPPSTHTVIKNAQPANLCLTVQTRARPVRPARETRFPALCLEINAVKSVLTAK
jgi:hypothetical protein